MPNNENIFQWAVIGAGPAGIAAVGKLIDQGVEPKAILWIDPHFKAGDLGQLWRNVSSNTTVARFTDFLEACKAFSYQNSTKDFTLDSLPPENTCTLSEIVEPLQWVSDELRQKVTSDTSVIRRLNLARRKWTLHTDATTFTAQNVILATGAQASLLDYPGVDVIPFEIAIDKERLSQVIDLNNTYAVFGSSHSAIIIVRHLVEAGVKKVINFYRSPCRYAVEMGDWILFDNTGLKGQTAAWARDNIDGILPSNLIRYNTSDHSINRYLPECNQVIYAVGFEPRNNIVIEDYPHANYNPHTGIIGPGLFGLGIGYPEIKSDPLGNVESQVGLWKFMVYLDKILPAWLKYHA